MKSSKNYLHIFKDYLEADVSPDKRAACNQIAGHMFDVEVESDPNLEAIAVLAGELELPDHHLSKSRSILLAELYSALNGS